jgi:thiol-disulfide isomerase/thioredoxin
MSKVFVGAAKKQDAKKALEKRPVLVFFYMIGCPHCEATKPAWEEAKKNASGKMDVVEVEASATPDDEDVQGFPTMKYKKEDGSETTTSGEKSSASEIEKDLDLPDKKKGGLRRRRSTKSSRGRLHSRRNRKLRHRTLRNHVSLRK